MSNQTTGSRRQFLKLAGVGSIGMATSLAGCLGGDGTDGTGGGSDGSDGGGDDMGDGAGGGGDDGSGDGGDGSDGAGDGSGDGGSNGGAGDQLENIRIAMAPLGILLLPLQQYIEPNNVLADKMEERGYSYDLSLTWEEVVLGASGQADIIPTIGSAEAARLGVQRDIPMSVNTSGFLIQYVGWLTNEGSPYDIAESGSEQASFDRMVEDQATIGMGPWSGGHIPTDGMIVKEFYDYEFREDGDFSIVNADYAVLSELLANEEVDVAITAPPVHAPQLMGPDPSFSAIYWPPHKLVEMGFKQDTLALANSVSTQQFAEEHAGALEAWVQSWHEGMQWVVDQTPADLVTGEEVIQALSAQSREEAEFILDWAFNFFETPVAPVNIELTDEEIDYERRGVQKAEELGFVPSGWEDQLTYTKIPQT